MERPDGAMPTQSLDAAVSEINKEQTNPTDAAEHFASEPAHSMWDEPKHDDEDDTPAFLRRRKKNKDQGEV